MKIRELALEDLPELQKISRETFFETFAELNSAENMDKYLSENLSFELLKGEFLTSGYFTE